MRFFIVCLSLLMAVTANAALIELTPGTTSIKNVPISASGVVKVDGADVNLTTIAAGLRKKYVVFVGTDVYVAQLLTAEPESYNKSNSGNDALLSLAGNSVVAMRLDFTYNVPADKLYTAFVDALGANNVDTTATDIAAFLKAVQDGGTAASGQSITFLMVKNADSTDTVVYENPTGGLTEIDGAAGFGQKVLSMWLGNILSNDKGLKELKDQLTK